MGPNPPLKDDVADVDVTDEDDDVDNDVVSYDDDTWEYDDFDEDEDGDWYDRLSAEQQREVDEREAFNDKLDMFRREY